MKNVLLLSTCTDNAKIALWCLREAGFSSVVVGNQSKNRDLRSFSLCKKFYEMPEFYTFKKMSEEIIPFLKYIAVKEAVDIICPTGFESLKFLSKYQDRLNDTVKTMTAPAVDTVKTLNNKYKFAQFCKQHSISHPNFYLLEDASILNQSRLPVNFPLLIKPLESSNSEGIRCFHNMRSLEKYLSNTENSLPLLLQEFIPGEDIDLNAFAINGCVKSWTIQRYIYVPYGKKILFKWYQFVKNDKVLRTGKTILEHFKYSGPINIGFRIDSRDNCLKAIEVNPRFWASTFYSICDGVNFIDVGVRLAFNSNYTLAPKYSNRLWGNFWKIPALIFMKGNTKVIRFLPRFTLLQVRYIFKSFLLHFLSCIKKFFKRYQYAGN